MNLRVLIAAEHASFKFGGEASLPLHYYRILRQREIPTWLVVHERTKEELQSLFPEDSERIIYIKDTVWHRLMWNIGTLLPKRLAQFTTGFILRMMTQLTQRRIIKKLVQQEKINIIHQPIPVSPKEPSILFDMGAPVIIGPMNGGMDYPPAFQQNQSKTVSLFIYLGRASATLMNSLIPGKKKAAVLLVANERTRQALPKGVCEQVRELVENGVDLALWQTDSTKITKEASSFTRYVFVGRLVDWKAVDLLLLAFSAAAKEVPMSLMIIGEGEERSTLESQSQELELLADSINQPGKVYFTGWMSQKDCAQQLKNCDAMILPSLLECGGAVVLEAMAGGIPVIATAWGGPADYLDSSCGILVEPTSRESFIENLSQAMVQLAQSPAIRQEMGKAGREKVVQLFDWNVKVDKILEIYNQVSKRDYNRPMNILEILRGDYARFPINQTYTLYADRVHFKDPLTEFSGIERYKKMIDFMSSWFQEIKMDLHQIKQEDQLIETSWTLCWRSPLPWRPRISISGRSELTVNPEGLIISHYDYWEKSPWDVLKQHFFPQS